MPNHVTHKVIISGTAEDVEAFRNAHIVMMNNAEDRFAAHGAYREWLGLDFNTFIPMPPIMLQIEESTVTEMAVELLLWRADNAAPFSDQVSTLKLHYDRIRSELGMKDAKIAEVATAYFTKNPKAEEQARMKLQAILDYGYGSWYPWSIANWGTKWNAYDFVIKNEDPFTFVFDTAWSVPWPILNRAVELHPNLTFDISCYDEGGNFAGEGLIGANSDHNPFRVGKEPEMDMRAIYERVYGEPYPNYEDEECEE